MKPPAVALAVLVMLISAIPSEGGQSRGMSYLDNGVIRFGADLDIGGAVTYIADSQKKVNIINSHDWGRQVQMSFYSGPKPFEPDGKKPADHWKQLGWNPIQSGDYKGHRSKVVEHKNNGKEIYIKCIPMHWPLANQPGQCTFECWYKLQKNTVLVRSKLNNNRSDKTQYQGRNQELPAVYTNGPLYRLMTYTGDKPFTGDKLTRIVKTRKGGFPWERYQATENWSALVRDDNWGLGVWNSNSQLTLGGFAGKPGKGGPKDGPTGYISPLQNEILDHNIRYEYSYVLILGSLKEIRKYVCDHSKKPGPPNYVFDNSRQHWVYRHATDKGWPIKGELHIMLDQKDPHMIGPTSFWQAKDAPVLYIHAAYKTEETTGQVFWKTHESGNKYAGNIAFPVVGDGKFRVYEIDLSKSPKYTGAITGLRFDPVNKGSTGSYIRIKSISFKKPS